MFDNYYYILLTFYLPDDLPYYNIFFYNKNLDLTLYSSAISLYSYDLSLEI